MDSLQKQNKTNANFTPIKDFCQFLDDGNLIILTYFFSSVFRCLKENVLHILL